MKSTKYLCIGTLLFCTLLISGCLNGPNGDDLDDDFDNGDYGENWQSETVDESGWVGIDASIAVDTTGNPSISYFDEGQRDLKYAYKQADYWVVKVVDSEGSIGEESGLAIDSQDIAHISYNDSTNGDLKYAKGQKDDWDIETVDTADLHHVVTTSLVLDSQENPHIIYNSEMGEGYDDDNGDDNEVEIDENDLDLNDEVKHAYWDGETWQLETVALFGTDVYAAIDIEDKLHVCIVKTELDAGTAYVYYTSNSSGEWTTEEVDKAGRDCGIDVDSNNVPHVTYRDFKEGLIKYAYKNNGLWDIQTVATNVGSDEGLRMAIDSGDNPHIVYNDNEQEKLMHAVLQDDFWTKEIINRMGIPSIVIDHQDQIHVAHGHSVEVYDALHEEIEILQYSVRE